MWFFALNDKMIMLNIANFTLYHLKQRMGKQMSGRKTNKKNRKLCLLLTLTLIVTMLTPATSLAAESTFPDTKGHWADGHIAKAVSLGFVKGYPNGTFLPDKPVTRAEFAKMLNTALGNRATASINFKDVPQNEWYYGDISKAVAAAYVSGYETGLFSPDSPITRQEAALIISRIVPTTGFTSNLSGYKDAAAISDWSYNALQRVAGKGYIGAYNDGLLHPGDPLTRAQTAKIICDIIQKENIVTADTTLKTDGTKTSNRIYTNGLTLQNDAKDGTAYLQNCTVLGDLNISGTGEGTVELADCRISKGTMEKSAGLARLFISGETSVGTLAVSKNAYIRSSGLAGGTFGPGFKNLIAEANSDLTLKGGFPLINVNGAAARVMLEDAGLEKLVVGQSASASEITVPYGSTITSAEVNSASSFRGSGNIFKMNANANGITYDTTPASVQIAPTVTVLPGAVNIRLTVTSNPLNGTTAIPLNQAITLTFNQFMTGYRGNLLQDSDITGIVKLRIDSAEGREVPCTATINNTKRIMTLRPNSNLQVNTRYYITMDKDLVKTGSGEANLALSSYFNTVAATDTLRFFPENGNAAATMDVRPTITFDSPVQGYTGTTVTAITDAYLESQLIFRENDASGRNVSFTAYIDRDNKVITVIPASTLSPGGKYYLGFQGNSFQTATALPIKIPGGGAAWTVVNPALKDLTVVSVSDTEGTLSVLPNQSGTVYAILQQGGTTPTAEQISAGKNSSSAAAIKAVNAKATANTKLTLPAFTGLTNNTALTCYAVLQSGPYTSAVVSLPLTTTLPPATLLSLSVNSGVMIDKVFNKNIYEYTAYIPYSATPSVTLTATSSTGTIQFSTGNEYSYGPAVKGMGTLSLPLFPGDSKTVHIRASEEGKADKTYKVICKADPK